MRHSPSLPPLEPDGGCQTPPTDTGAETAGKFPAIGGEEFEMTTNEWRSEIQRALDSGAVVEVVQRFMRDADLQALPEACRPYAVVAPADIYYWAFILAMAWLDRDDKTPFVLGDTSLVFSDAARRVGELVASEHVHLGFINEHVPAIRTEPREQPFVDVFEYEYWDADEMELVRSDFAAPLEAIRNGLGQPLLATGRKVAYSQLDTSGRIRVKRPSGRTTT